MIVKMIVVGSSSQGYKTASDYLARTALGSASMVFFPHIQPHLIRNSLTRFKRNFEAIQDGTEIRPGFFYIGSTGDFDIDRSGYSGGNKKFSVQKRNGKYIFRLTSEMEEDLIDNSFIEMYRVFGNRTIAVILRGAGTDGVESAKEIYEGGGKVLIEGLPSGMTEHAKYRIPKAEVIAPENIPDRLERLIERV